MRQRYASSAKFTLADGFRLGVGIAFWLLVFCFAPWALLLIATGVF